MIADYSMPLRRPADRWERQRRLAVAVASALVVAIALVIYLGSTAYGGTGGGAPETVTVRSGDTVWSIAASHSEGGDLRERVDAIVSANHLATGAALRPGQTLVVPPG